MQLTLQIESPVGRLELSKRRPLDRWTVRLPDGRTITAAGTKAQAIAAACNFTKKRRA